MEAKPDAKDDKPKPEDSPVTLAQMIRAMRWQDLVIVVTAIGALGTGYRTFVGAAQAQADAGLKPIVERVEKLEDATKEMKADSKNLHDDMRNIALDIRDLYRSAHYGDRSERLEKPPMMTDAGPTP